MIGLSAVGGADYGGRGRIRVAVFVLGAGASLGLAFLLEGLRNRRAEARGLGSGVAGETDPAPRAEV